MVALITGVFGLLVAVVGLWVEARKGRSILGSRAEEDPTLIELLTGMYGRLGSIEIQHMSHNQRLSSVEDTVERIDGRVIHLEDVLGVEAVVNEMGSRGLIDRREDTG